VDPEGPFRNPFVGPVPFERDDADVFFGREGEARELVSRIVANRVVVLYAASGAGKTSLLNAGVLPVLEREERFEVLPPTRFSRLTTEAEHGAGVENVYVSTTLSAWSEQEFESTRAAQATLADFVAARPHRRDPRGRPLSRVAVFDQFEEIFTVHPEYWEHREGLFVQLAEALEADRYLRLVFALREDYVAQLEPLLPSLPSHVRFHLERLGREAAIDAVTRPVAKGGRSFGPEVAEALVHDLQTLRVDVGQDQPNEIPGEFVEPVQLQVVCHSLWSELPPDVEQITDQHVQAFGDVDEVLERFYDDAVRVAARPADVSERRLRQWVEDAFITSVGTRSTIYRTAESTADIPNAAIEELEDRHLIRGDWRAGARWYELTHDRFIGPIQSSNARFRADISRRRMRRARVAGAVLALLVLAFVAAAWGLTSGSEGSLEPAATISIKRVAPNVSFRSYQQVIGQEPSGPFAQLIRRGNLLYVQISTRGYGGEFLVIKSSTIEATPGVSVHEGPTDPRATVKPESNSEDQLVQIWIPLPPRSGRFRNRIVLSTKAGVVLDEAVSDPFTTTGSGARVQATNTLRVGLDVTRSGPGSVVSSPAGIDCGFTCSSAYARGTSVSLVAVPASGSRFKGWRGACRGNGACRLKLQRPVSVAALFTATFDFVRAGTPTGVRYRLAPRYDAYAPGGAAENSRVRIYCYTKGQSVLGNSDWAKIAVAPDRYVPAAFLRHGRLGRPRGVATC
jgi:hypothetical protein